MLVAEIALRPFATNSVSRAISREEVRQYYEGTSTAHFLPDGARSTGNAVIPGARVGMILGDSHVDAVQVNDEKTMGSVLERALRAQGESYNVCQYGWSGVAAPMYMAMADALLREHNPAWVAVTINERDLGTEPLASAWAWRMKINPDTSVSLVDASPKASTGIYMNMMNAARSHSSLFSVAVETGSKIMASQSAGEKENANSQEDNSETALVPRATVRGLKQAYGPRLFIVYIARVGAVGGTAPDDVETRLLDACREEGITCASTRAAMIADRDNFFRLSRGFHNTAPGTGHLNEVGHELVAREIWRVLSTEGTRAIGRNR